MDRFMQLASRHVSRLRGKFDRVRRSIGKAARKVKDLARQSHLFAKGKDDKKKLGKKIHKVVKATHAQLAALLAQGHSLSSRPGKQLKDLVGVMGKLLPQIAYFQKTGFVARHKIIHLTMPDLYAVVRGKVGKAVEFGLKWGISRIGCGFVQGFLLSGRNPSDRRFCIEAIKQHQAVFGQAPKVYGFDRGGFSGRNVRAAKKLGVKHVGIAPMGKAAWAVSERMRKRIVRARARVEGSIGTLKSSCYGLNKPRARSTEAMARCGHRAILGFNLRKLVNEWTAMQEKAALA
jgi:hypothetical protein